MEYLLLTATDMSSHWTLKELRNFYFLCIWSKDLWELIYTAFVLIYTEGQICLFALICSVPQSTKELNSLKKTASTFIATKNEKISVYLID